MTDIQTNDIQSLLSLPLETLVTLGCGYLGYKIAYLGKDDRHQTHDVIFISIVFGALAQARQIGPAGHIERPVAAAAALLMTLLLGAIWRRVNPWVVRHVINKASGSIHDGHMTALQSVNAREYLIISQLFVTTKNGVEYLSNMDVSGKIAPDLHYIGHDGSISMYVTHKRGPDDEDWKDLTDYLTHETGALVTYFPAGEIEKNRDAACPSQPESRNKENTCGTKRTAP